MYYAKMCKECWVGYECVGLEHSALTDENGIILQFDTEDDIEDYVYNNPESSKYWYDWEIEYIGVIK